MSSIFLCNASSFGTAVEPVEIIQTHVSLVFLAGDCATSANARFKFPYSDLSTVEERWAACEASSRSAPEWHLNFILGSER